jgi:sporulation protein YlmC with PRC-barrel domain
MNYTEHDQYGMYRNAEHKGPGPFLMGAETLIGNEVYNGQEEHLGEIKEIMLETGTGKVAYAVLSYGGVLGMGDKLFAVPWNALKLDTVNKRFMLDVDKERLKNAPGFDKDAWPSMSDRKWGGSLHEYYGTRPYWEMDQH